MHHTAVRLPESPPTGPVFDEMACPAVVEAGKQLVSGRISPRQFDASGEAKPLPTVAEARAAWERRTAAPVAAVSPRG